MTKKLCVKNVVVLILITLSPFLVWYGGGIVIQGLSAVANDVYGAERQLYTRIVLSIGDGIATTPENVTHCSNDAEFLTVCNSDWTWANELLQTGWGSDDARYMQLLSSNGPHPAYICFWTDDGYNFWEVTTSKATCDNLLVLRSNGAITPGVIDSKATAAYNPVYYTVTMRTAQANVNSTLTWLSLHILILGSIILSVYSFKRRKTKT